MNKPILGKGRTAVVFEYDSTKVVKLFHTNISLDTINKEFNSYKVINDIPLVAKLLSIKKFDNQYGFIMEKAIGMSLLEKVIEEPSKIKIYAQMMAKAHYEIHSYQRNFEPSLINIFKSISKPKELSENDFAFVNEYIAFMAKTNPLTSVCHGDFHPDNIIVNGDLKVVDWGNTYVGNPLSDVARTFILLSGPAMPAGINDNMRALLQEFKINFSKYYINEYILLGNCSLENINKWLLPMAVLRLTENIADEKNWLLNLISQEIQKAKC